MSVPTDTPEPDPATVRKDALILVDIQYDFLPGGSLAVPEGDAILPVMHRLLNEGKWALIVVSQDFHPPNHISFASRHGQPAFTSIRVPDEAGGGGGEKEQELWPDHCVQGTKGAEIESSVSDALKRLSTPVIHIQKGLNPNQDAYSSFQSPSHPLLPALQHRSITHLTLAGLAADFCVRATARDAALAAAFERVWVVREGTRAVAGGGEWEKVVTGELEGVGGVRGMEEVLREVRGKERAGGEA